MYFLVKNKKKDIVENQKINLILNIIKIISILNSILKKLKRHDTVEGVILKFQHTCLKSDLSFFMESSVTLERSVITRENNPFLNLTAEDFSEFCNSITLILDQLIDLDNNDVLDLKKYQNFFHFIRETNPTFKLFFKLIREDN